MFYAAFMDEMEKMAIVGKPLGRLFREMGAGPSIRSELASKFNQLRRDQGPMVGRIMLAGARAGAGYKRSHLKEPGLPMKAVERASTKQLKHELAKGEKRIRLKSIFS